MMFVRKKLPQQFGVRQWDSLDVTSGPDSGDVQRRGTVSAVGTGGIDHWNKKKKRTQVAQNDISGKSQLNSI